MVMGGSSHSAGLEEPPEQAPEPLEQVEPLLPHGRTSRRNLLRGAGVLGVGALGAAWAVEEGLLPGGDRLNAVLGRRKVWARVPDVPRGNFVHGAFDSAARNGRRTGWSICWPHGTATGTPLPVLLMLHGRASDHTAVFEGLAMDRFLGGAIENGLAPFAIASVDGGRDYWKPAPDGSDAGRMVVEELVPLLAEHGLDTATMSLGGWSMGGYGSLRLAGLGMLPARSVGVFAPALHRDEGRDDVLYNPQRLLGLPLQVSCGRGDRFYPVDREYVAALRRSGVTTEWHTGAGAHTQPFWRSFVPSLLRFTGRHLSA